MSQGFYQWQEIQKKGNPLLPTANTAAAYFLRNNEVGSCVQYIWLEIRATDLSISRNPWIFIVDPFSLLITRGRFLWINSHVIDINISYVNFMCIIIYTYAFMINICKDVMFVFFLHAFCIFCNFFFFLQNICCSILNAENITHIYT